MRSSIRKMRVRLAADRGFTLIELLVAMSLMLVVLTATLNALDRTTKIQRRTEKSNDQQETVRLAIDRMATQLRNLASPTTSALKTIDRAGSYDLIFQTTDPNKQWVRYCLADGSNSPAPFTGFVASTASNERLWYQTPNNDFLALSPAKSPSAVTSPASMTSTCPVAPTANGSGAGWLTATVAVDHITNKRNSLDRPVFTTNITGADTSTITYVRGDLYNSFATLTNNPVETRLSTGLYLRNQNQSPTAAIQWQAGSGGGTTRTFQFNGTASSDPEGRTLQFLWYKGTPATASATAAKLPSCATNSAADQTLTTGTETWTCIGSGALLTYTFLQPDWTRSWAIALKVTDPGGLPGVATQTNFAVP